jgi:hypothetical protein
LPAFNVSDDGANDVREGTIINCHLVLRNVECAFGNDLLQIPSVIWCDIPEVELDVKAERFDASFVESNKGGLCFLEHDKRRAWYVRPGIAENAAPRETVNQIQLEDVPSRTVAQAIYVVGDVTTPHGQFCEAMFLNGWRRASWNPNERQFITSLVVQAYRCIPTLPICDRQTSVSVRPTA